MRYTMANLSSDHVLWPADLVTGIRNHNACVAGYVLVFHRDATISRFTFLEMRRVVFNFGVALAN